VNGERSELGSPFTVRHSPFAIQLQSLFQHYMAGASPRRINGGGSVSRAFYAREKFVTRMLRLDPG